MLDHRKVGLDIARAVAILLVLVAHLAKDNFLAGVLGVEIFFALSGFLIGQIIWRNILKALFGVKKRYLISGRDGGGVRFLTIIYFW